MILFKIISLGARLMTRAHLSSFDLHVFKISTLYLLQQTITLTMCLQLCCQCLKILLKAVSRPVCSHMISFWFIFCLFDIQTCIEQPVKGGDHRRIVNAMLIM